MAKNAKGKGKGGSAASTKSALGASSTSTSSASATRKLPPAPYSTPPPVLRPFLEELNPEHIYITHIDSFPRRTKQRMFLLPIVINLAAAALLLWRLKAVLPYYTTLILSVWGYHNSMRVDVKAAPWKLLADEIFSRTFVLLFDFAIFRFLLPWPANFFLGSRSPTAWRLTLGFRDEEVCVRRSRRWDAALPQGWLREEAADVGAVYRERIMPAIDREWVKSRTAYLLMDKSWDLDFGAMLKAHELIGDSQKNKDKGHQSTGLGLEHFRKTVIVYSEENGWLVWPIWRLDEGGEAEQTQDEGRRKILAFKEKLLAMGKEDLFYRWIEIIQFETSAPGGFTDERQASAMRQARELFAANGVDFGKFWEEIGGAKGMPGLGEEQSAK